VSADVTFGIGLPLDDPVEELVELAQSAEELGYASVWANDDRLQRDVFSVLGALALGTERVRLGPGVTNPYSRHPALVAAAVATLDEISGGRAVLGLGAGGTNHRALGVRREAPVSALREAVELIRGLLAGREVTLQGRIIRAREAKLDFEPRRASLPIFIGARGPRMLELAGEIADGVIVGNIANPQGWAYALRHASLGAERAGRESSEVAFTAWLYCSIADDPAEAADAVRPMVATSLVTSRPILHELGLELPEPFVRAMDETGWSLERESVTRAGQHIAPDLLAWFSLAGTAPDCRRRLHELLAAFPRITEVVIVPFPQLGQSRAQLVTRFIHEVARGSVVQVTG
jgi:5,10-methylenetetrahydromethanopterin reductase